MTEATKNVPPAATEEPQDPAEKQPQSQKNVEIRTVEGSCHTPIVGEHHFGRFRLPQRKMTARPWVGRVYVLGNGRLVEYGRDAQPTAGELLWSGYRALFEVDLSIRRLRLEIILPSAGDAFVFRTAVDVQWRVIDPKRVVRQGVTDVRDVMVPRLLDGLRQASRTMLANDVEAAEKTANAYFSHDWLDQHGLWTEVLVRLRMDPQKEGDTRLAAEVQAYKSIIAGGDLDQFALQIARNPDDIARVVEVLVHERDTYRREVFDYLTRLLESDALDRWEVDDKVRVLLQGMEGAISYVLTGADAMRQDSYVDSARRSHSAGGPGDPTDGP